MILPSENDACFCYEHGFDHHNISKNKLLRDSPSHFSNKIFTFDLRYDLLY